MLSKPVIGGDLVRVLTAGMYDNPLVLYREYVQNAVDSIASCHNCDGRVHITIDPLNARVTIRDNGTGLSPTQAGQRLVNIGRSKKDPSIHRGFRGIGRLSALAFAEQVHFTTRAKPNEPITQVTWDGRVLRNLDLLRFDAATVIEKCTNMREVDQGEWPERFFQVTIDRVNRHAASVLLNEDAVHNYIAEVCPVPLRTHFPFAHEINDFISAQTELSVIDIRINNNKTPVQRPFGQTIPLTNQYGASYEKLEFRLIPRLDEDHPAAVVWLAHTSYAGSIPQRLGIRGLRARAGNIQIGTDNIFEDLFVEPRFNGWCIGEVHILDSRLVPNARRDYFESGPHLRNLENHIGAIANEISSRCRRASSQRNKLRNLNSAIHRLRRARDLAVSGYLEAKDASALVERERQKIPEIEALLANLEPTTDSDHELPQLTEALFEAIEANTKLALAGVSVQSIPLIQTTFGVIATTMPPETALPLIESILSRLQEHPHCSDHGSINVNRNKTN